MIKLEVAAWSDVGRQREVNQDRVFYQVLQSSDADPIALCIVADGMGGHLAGEVASHWAVETLKRELSDLFVPTDPRQTMQLTGAELRALAEEASPDVSPSDVAMMRKLRKAVERANAAVHEYALRRPEEAMGTGSTLTMALLRGQRAYVVNVGDSRTYLLREGHLTQLTHDHSVVADLVAAGCLTVEESFRHPQASLITRCLGYLDKIEADVEAHRLEPEDGLLLCTDGLWEALREPAMMVQVIESTPNLETAAHRLVDAANRVGGHDNISAALLRVTEAAALCF